MYGAWGAAVANTNSKLMQFSALDWDVDGPFKVCLFLSFRTLILHTPSLHHSACVVLICYVLVCVVQDYPQITVYHPTPGSGNGQAFANIGWTGWVGSITGTSRQHQFKPSSTVSPAHLTTATIFCVVWSAPPISWMSSAAHQVSPRPKLPSVRSVSASPMTRSAVSLVPVPHSPTCSATSSNSTT